MSWDIDPKIVSMLVDGIEEVASWAWGKIAGSDKSEKLAALKKAAAEAAALALQSEILTQATLLGLELQVDNLGSLADEILESMTVLHDSRKTVPTLDIVIEELPPEG